MKELIKLSVIGLTYSQPIQPTAPAYALVLAEENGIRRVPIIVGVAEAQSIAMFLQNLSSSRPLTHDLFVALMDAYKIRLQAVIIYKFDYELFFSEILFENEQGIKVKIDARTSDAIALALRTASPIYTTEEVMQRTSVEFDPFDFGDDEDDIENAILDLSLPKPKRRSATTNGNFATLDLTELETELDLAVGNENYEKARLLSEEIKKRKRKK